MATRLKKIIYSKTLRIIAYLGLMLFGVIGSIVMYDADRSYPRYYFDTTDFQKESENFSDKIFASLESGKDSDELKKNAEYNYFVTYRKKGTEEKITLTNTDLTSIKQIVAKRDYYFSYSNITDYGEEISYSDFSSIEYIIEDIDDYIIEEMYIVVNPEFLAEKNKVYEQQLYNYENSSMAMISSMAVIVVYITILLIYLTFVTWNQSEKTKNFLDGWYTEIQVFIIITILALYFSIGTELPHYGGIGVLLMLLSVLATVTATFLYLSCVRKVKNNTIFTESFFSKNFTTITEHVTTIVDKNAENYTKKLQSYTWLFIVVESVGILITLLSFATSMISLAFLGLIFIIVSIVLFYQQTKKLTLDIDKEVSEVVAEQMKAERLKIELVTNVSHDLKTPLTSLISYIDLLADEPLKDVQKAYVDVLKNKTNVLSRIINDLFDLAKVTSGNIEPQLEKINFTNLIEQTLVDFEDNLKKSRMKIKTNFIEDAYILADGNRLHRAILNLIDNAIKYSNKKTRIYLNLIEKDNRYLFSIQSTANYEMDFSKDEIIERFVRADKARTSEGSGLGLSIAKSFVEISNGKFDIYVDGDQFNVKITFPKLVEQLITKEKK